MATAPRPGTTRPAKQQAIIISVRGEDAYLYPADLGPRDDAAARKAYQRVFGEKVSVMGALQGLDADSIGGDLICLLWWIARRKAGIEESFEDAVDQFPTVGEFEDALDLRVEEDTEDDAADPLVPVAD